MNANERFEIMASVFNAMTGYMAPGKSVPPMAYAGEEYERDRQVEWSNWLSSHGEVVRMTLNAVEAQNGNEESQS